MTGAGILESDRAASDPQTGYLVVGHGTRSRAGQDQVRAVFSQMQSLVGPESLQGAPAELAFLELAEPDIPTAVERLARSGVCRLVVVPVLLFTAGHAQQDIPDAVDAAARQFGMQVVRHCSSLCLDPTIVALSSERFYQALRTELHAEPTATQLVEEVAFALIGRGSSSEDATSAMLQFAELRSQATRCNWSSVGFIHAQRPTVDEALDGLAATGLPLLVVQPHLLFEGELVEELRQEVEYRQSFSTSQKWIVANTLGAGVERGDSRLAAALCKLAIASASPTAFVSDSSNASCSRCHQAVQWCRVRRPNAAVLSPR